MKQLPNAEKKGIKDVAFDVVGKIINRTTLMYTIMSLIICIVGAHRPANSQILSSSVFLWFALFSFLVSIVSSITDFLKKKNVNAVIVCTIHFILSYAAFFAIFIHGDLFQTYLTSANATHNNPLFTGLMLTLIYIGAYIVIFGIMFAFMYLADRIKRKPDDYEKIYTESEEK